MQLIKSKPIVIPAWIIIAQSVCFAILYAVWMLPKTTFLRNSCLGLGAILSLFVLFQFRRAFVTKVAIPIYLLIALYVWLLFHLFFLSNDYQAQYLEFISVWKNSAIGIVFGLGFGISLAHLVSQTKGASERQKYGSKTFKLVWMLIWLGLIAPEVIYLIKWVLMRYGADWGLNVQDYLKLWRGSAPFYVSKNTYVCFCLPVLAVALGQIKYQLDQNCSSALTYIFYVGTIFGVLFVFWGEQIFNGFIYTLLCSITLGCMLFWKHFKHTANIQELIVMIFICSLTTASVYQIKSDPHFQSFLADAKVAVQLDKYPQWKNGEHGYPQNEFGFEVNGSNYERVSWFIYGLQLIPRYPSGYGLLQSSFGHLVINDHPNSKIQQSHSGWIDLILGIGLPGAGFILAALFLAMRGCSQSIGVFSGANISRTLQMRLYHIGYWILLSLGLAWCTTELSQRIYIDNLLFWIALATGLSIGSRSYKID